MKLIRDLICSSTPFGEMYTDNDLSGTIIMDDNKLEGILRDDFEKEYLAFGKVNDDTVEIILSSNSDKETPKIYEGKLDGKMYYGDKSVINHYIRIGIEECKIGIYDPEKYRTVLDTEMERIERLVNYKKTLMGEESKILYDELMGNTKSKQLSNK